MRVFLFSFSLSLIVYQREVHSNFGTSERSWVSSSPLSDLLKPQFWIQEDQRENKPIPPLHGPHRPLALQALILSVHMALMLFLSELIQCRNPVTCSLIHPVLADTLDLNGLKDGLFAVTKATDTFKQEWPEELSSIECFCFIASVGFLNIKGYSYSRSTLLWDARVISFHY